MIRVVIEDTVFSPHLFCDHCNQRISGADVASAVWPIAHEGAVIKTSHPQYVHKELCHSAIELRLRNQGYQMGFEELRTHLQRLQASLGSASTTTRERKSSQPAEQRA